MVVTLDGTLIITTLIGAVVTVLLAYMAKVQGDIHKAVNTNYQASERALEDMRRQLVAMGQVNATFAEQIRGTDLASARRDGVNEGTLIPAPQPAAPAISVINGDHAPTTPPIPVEIVNVAPVPVDQVKNDNAT